MSEHVDFRVCSAPLLVVWDSVRFYDPDGRSKHWSEGSLKQIHPKGDIIYMLTKLISALWMHVTYLFTKRVTNACLIQSYIYLRQNASMTWPPAQLLNTFNVGK